MHYVILFTDNPDADPAIRTRLMGAHLDFLEANGDRILSAGPLREGDAPAGGMWVVDLAAADEAKELVEADPFWPTGLRASWRVLAWRQVFADGKRRV
ncbi:MAG: YciI family protein [Pseudomonadota bacterium]